MTAPTPPDGTTPPDGAPPHPALPPAPATPLPAEPLLVEAHLVETHLTEPHLVELHLTEPHLVELHLVEPHFVEPHPAEPVPAEAVPADAAASRRFDLQGWSAVVTALVGVATLGAGFAGGYLSQPQGATGSRPQPTVTVSVPVPGPTVTVTAPGTGPPPVGTPTGGAPAGPRPSAAPALLASPDSGRGGTRTVLSGQGFPPGAVVRVSFVVKGESDVEYLHRDLRDTASDAAGAFSVEVAVPSDLDGYADRNTYLRARAGTGAVLAETVFDLLP
ncbi:hypothetical protein [Kitasatospora cineracea]|uniref:Uncharacterized protein n=1 Tax=Kitasatospora cineracea TaxID=88074 RepID=A0A8G1UL42_9ACTN|nr:hypothetical protein [Kitasatospora cineracea]ROR44984.1 hypothetical protein EDD39_3195 [Kitasatospora cineracea]